jgi:outer membrane protein assembly factor BamD
MQKLFVLALTVLLIVSSGGCSSTPIDESDPASLLKDAEEDIESDHYQIAIDKLRTIKNKFPYSKYAVDAQLRIADVFYLQEAYGDAAASYEAFRDLHPRHEKTPYAMFKIGKSHLHDAPRNVARDLIPAQKALSAFNDFISRYPTAPEATEAKEDISQLRNLLAEKEFYIGDFYFKRDYYDSAKPRYKKVIELYPETDAAKKAEARLTKIDSLAKHED